MGYWNEQPVAGVSFDLELEEDLRLLRDLNGEDEEESLYSRLSLRKLDDDEEDLDLDDFEDDEDEDLDDFDDEDDDDLDDFDDDEDDDEDLDDEDDYLDDYDDDEEDFN